jgi:hypothetical protein
MEKILFEFNNFIFLVTQFIIVIFFIILFVLGVVITIQDFIEKIKRR